MKNILRVKRKMKSREAKNREAKDKEVKDRKMNTKDRSQPESENTNFMSQ